jgi:diguanylate cyclase (GGDEF)-like protein
MNQKTSRVRIAAASFVALFLVSSLYLFTKDLGTIISQQRKILEQAAKTASLWVPQKNPQGSSLRQNSQTLTDSQLSEALFRAELDLVAVADLDLVDTQQIPPLVIASSHPQHKKGQSLDLPESLIEALKQRRVASTPLEWTGTEWKIIAVSPIEGSDSLNIVLHAPQGGFVWSLLTHAINYLILCLGFLFLGSMFISPVFRKKRALETVDETHQLQQKIVTDPLTQIYNRGYFDYFISSQHLRWVALEGCSMLVIDIDNFKQINDQWGHATGDDILVSFSQFLKSFFRKSDKVIRYGGDEFVVMLSSTKLREALRISQNFIHSLKDQTFAKGIKITVSVGVAEYVMGEAGKDWFERADSALYNVKSSGKNSAQAMDPSQLELVQ